MTEHRWQPAERGHTCKHCQTFARVGETGELVIRNTSEKREPGGSVYGPVPRECTGVRLDVMRGGPRG